MSYPRKFAGTTLQNKIRFLPPSKGFMGLSGEELKPDIDESIWVLPYGYEGSVCYGKGTSAGPQSIINASAQIELYDDYFGVEAVRHYGIATIDTIVSKRSSGEVIHELDTLVEWVLESGKFPFVIGGEHSITAGSIRPFIRRHEKITIVQFDAHSDLRDSYLGSSFSHACVMRRCLDSPQVCLVALGVRSISKEEIEFAEANKERISIFWARDKDNWSLNEITRSIGSGPVYITFDVDALDSSLMPATGTPEPGGLYWQEVMNILLTISSKAKIVGIDVVEFSPLAGMHCYDFTVARLCYRLMNFALKDKFFALLEHS